MYREILKRKNFQCILLNWVRLQPYKMDTVAVAFRYITDCMFATREGEVDVEAASMFVKHGGLDLVMIALQQVAVVIAARNQS